MKRKLRICHVITRMIVGGAQENTLLTAIGLIEKGHDVVLLTGPSEGPEGKLFDKMKAPGLKVVEMPYLVRSLNPLKDFQAYIFMKTFFKKANFDVVHTHSSKAGVIGRIAAHAAKIPLVVHTVHGLAFHKYEKAWKNRIYINAEKFAAGRCHKIFAVAQAMIDQCLEAGIGPESKFKVVYSGMELENFLNCKPDPELKKELEIPENSFVVGKIARLFPLKGYEYFIPAAIKIAEIRKDVHFLIVGDGIMKEDICKQIDKAGIRNRFSFSGLVPPDQVHRYTALMDILAHLSVREGLPRTVVQALASGKPAVAFKLDGTPEVLKNGVTGFLAEPENSRQAADLILKMLQSPEKIKEMGEEGRALVADKFDWRKMTDIIEEEYFNNMIDG